MRNVIEPEIKSTYSTEINTVSEPLLTSKYRGTEDFSVPVSFPFESYTGTKPCVDSKSFCKSLSQFVASRVEDVGS